MMYSNKMVSAIKVDGRVLRENKEVVMLPFGTEYNIFLKNMSTVRAIVNVFIDGDDVTDGTGVIVYANSHLELERSIRKGNFEKGNRFLFIERTEQIEEHRGVGVEDGLIRIEYKFEKPVVYTYSPVQYNYYTTPFYHNCNAVFGGGLVNTASFVAQNSLASAQSSLSNCA